jgi:anti-sigma regulatory factor (Ser/Thr protein kinase)
MNDNITLVVPAQEDFRQVAQLVVGGLGARLDLTYEDLDDVQTAVEAVLGCREDDGDIHVVVAVAESSVRLTVGPFEDAQLDELDEDGSGFGLRRVLETVTDAFEVERSSGRAWVVMTKLTAATAEAKG